MVSKEELSQAVVQKSLVIPQQESPDEKSNQIGIIKGLSTENDLTRIELRLRGFTYSFFKSQWIQIRKPIMNDIGIGNYMATLQAFGDLAQFSNYEEKEIPKLVCLFFEDNYPTFILYADKFELNPQDFNIINTGLKFYALSVLKNAKNAGHRNVVRGTLSENVLQRALGSGEPAPKRSIIDRILKRNKGGQ